MKARAQALQREKEDATRRELAARAERDKQLAKEEEDRRQRREAQAREARRLELMRANQVLAEKVELERKVREGVVPTPAGNGNGEYDPFAEDVRLPRPTHDPSGSTSKTSKTRAKVGGVSSDGHPHAASSKPRPTGTSSKTANGSGGSNGAGTAKHHGSASPPPLGRKEKAARLFAQQAVKSSRGESLFSIRDLVEGREPGTVRPSPVKVEKTWSLTPRQRLNQDLQKEGLRKLCADRETRDRRTIDQIQQDARARKRINGGADKGKDGLGVKDKDMVRDMVRDKKRSSSPPVSKFPPKAKPKLPPIPTTARPALALHQQPHPHPLARASTPKRRRRSPSSSSYETDEDGTAAPPSKRTAGSVPSQAAISAEIQALFRRPDRPPPALRRAWSDEDSDDMEAGLSDVEAEERRTARIARLEDEAAEREERMHREMKERLKRERSRAKA